MKRETSNVERGTMKLFVPGRVCLFGEPSDWAGGYRTVRPDIAKGQAVILGTDQGIEAEVLPHPEALVLSSVAKEAGSRPRVLPMEPNALLQEARQGGFWSYVAGTALQVLRRAPVQGLVLENHAMDLPLRKGLSSSAAICVLTARAFNRVYGLGWTTRDEMEIAYQGETVTPSRCGRMDQGCAFGRRPIRMMFDGESLEVAEIVPGARFHLLVVDLDAAKDTRAILAGLNRAYPHPEDDVARGVVELLGPINARIVENAVAALVAGDAERLGSLMDEAQECFDRLAVPACPRELAAPALHRVLAYPPLRPHIFGGKGVGSQGDGAAQFVARSEADRDQAIAILARDLGLRAFALSVLPAR
jgi:hypothetical protein